MGHQGHTYCFVGGVKSHKEAEEKCRGLGGYPATFENPKEAKAAYNFARNLVNGDYVFVGGRWDEDSEAWIFPDKNGKQFDSGKLTVDYGNQSQECLAMYYSVWGGSHFEDVRCEQNNPSDALCEIE